MNIRNKLAGMIGLFLFVTAAVAQSPQGSDIQELTGFNSIKEVFNRDKGNVRFVALLSPSCGYCIKGYRYMRKILDEVSDSRLKMYVVWEPMLSGDSKDLAYQMSKKEDDPRMTYHSWDGERLSGKLYQTKMNLPRVAWDVYFLYDANSVWDEKEPSVPFYWQHQGAGGKENWLDYDQLLSKVKELLAQTK
ncbi:hypothetical protein L0222_31570 [bacterium]|nr:hypothetical protein [bacterium]MCI0606806.1 hypothetical protein [bacterium]